jgi:hypothetical protein
MSDYSSKLSPLETTTHQEHVIKHVVGATVLGWFIAGEAAHLLLDIGFLWTIYLDGEMNLLPQGVAIPELDADEINGADKAALAFDAELLLNEGREATGLRRFMPAPIECLIEAVDIEGSNSRRRILIQGEMESLKIESSIEAGEIGVSVDNSEA